MDNLDHERALDVVAMQLPRINDVLRDIRRQHAALLSLMVNLERALADIRDKG